ncbi:hypothetical protein O1M63_04755 [Streptomyces mirabilis]|nr:hypothetical protein [Streptomyces mirabilis]
MTPPQRLDSILSSGKLAGFPPFGVEETPCACLSESPPEHLAYLIADRGFAPWGIVLTRSDVAGVGGGSVAYVPAEVRSQFRTAGLRHWAVRLDADSQWTREREWRIPLPAHTDANGTLWGEIQINRLAAILIGDPEWRPTAHTTGWVRPESGEQAYPDEPGAHQLVELPILWRTAPIWIWDSELRTVEIHPAGTLA